MNSEPDANTAINQQQAALRQFEELKDDREVAQAV